MSKRMFSMEQIQQAMEDQNGFCIECGYEQGTCEPDARKYKCEECGKKAVYGAEELLVMGRVE